MTPDKLIRVTRIGFREVNTNKYRVELSEANPIVIVVVVLLLQEVAEAKCMVCQSPIPPGSVDAYNTSRSMTSY